MDKDKRLKVLLGKGYFPEELPPPFHTEDLAKHARYLAKKWSGKNSPITRYQRYSVARVGGSRRVLGITNPVSQFFLCKHIADNWIAIRKHIKKTRFAVIKPELADGLKRSIPSTNFDEFNFQKLSLAGSHYHLFFSDISRFYPTLYTHVIPWAIHGKEWSKANLNAAVYKNSLGAKLDAYVRYTQENQTIGLPIGPDTSRILSEIVAVAVEEKLAKELGGSPQGSRHIDDIVIGLDSLSEAEHCRSGLEKVLGYYELQINTEKTRIMHCSAFFDNSWPYELSQFQFGVTAPSQRESLDYFIRRVMDLSNEWAADNVLNYAIKRLRGLSILRSNWPLVEIFLLKAARSNGTCLPPAVQLMTYYNHRGFSLDKERISKFIVDSVGYHGPIGHHNEVAWALFLAKSLNITLPAKALEPLYDSDCSVVALIALDLYSAGLIKKSINTANWQKHLNADALYSDMWLLAYEADLKGWLTSSTPGFVASHPLFGDLRAKNISFYDPSKTVAPIRPTVKGATITAPENAVTANPFTTLMSSLAMNLYSTGSE